MCEYSEAVDAFEALLNQSPDYVPALKGLTENNVNQTAEYETEGFTGRIFDCCSKVMQLLVRANKLNPPLACMWSLMGHVCTLINS